MILDYKDIDDLNRYKIMSGTVIPRPIAWIVTEDEGVLNADKLWGMAKSVLMANDIPYIDLGVIESSVITQIGRTEGLKYIYSTYGGVHPVASGVDTLAILFNYYLSIKFVFVPQCFHVCV